jgi:hypothetical protein
MPQSFSELEEPLRALLARAESTPAGAWHLEDRDHALMVAAAETSAVTLPVTAFRSAAGAVDFLRRLLREHPQPAASSWLW